MRPFSNPNYDWNEYVQVVVRDNNVDQALKALKKKMQREGVFREMKLRNHFEKPSEKRAREKAEAVRRARKLNARSCSARAFCPARRSRCAPPVRASRCDYGSRFEAVGFAPAAFFFGRWDVAAAS